MYNYNISLINHEIFANISCSNLEKISFHDTKDASVKYFFDIWTNWMDSRIHFVHVIRQIKQTVYHINFFLQPHSHMQTSVW